jgi:predicted ATPase/class 3 adenylate cyclase
MSVHSRDVLFAPSGPGRMGAHGSRLGSAERDAGLLDGRRTKRLSQNGLLATGAAVVGDTARVVEGPSGTVTFLFTDVEGSTGLWERRPAEMEVALAAHDAVVRASIEEAGGYIFATGGDGFAAAFGRADVALAAAIEVQRALASVDWPAGAKLRVRMGVHTGEAHERGGDYFGPAVNRAARVMAAANGSQVLVSSSTRDVVAAELRPATRLADVGLHELRDVLEPVRLYRLEDPAFAVDSRPPRTSEIRVGNLPEAPGELLGRDADVDAVLADLSRGRLVTLTGVGGIGKTRLAIEVGRLLQPARRDGVWFAALDTIDQPDAVGRGLLSTLRIEPGSGRDLETVVDGMRFRHALLILDNCEHLLEVAAEVASAIVAGCPHVDVLATSREPLEVVGERARRVLSLDIDDDGPAVRLFRLRAESAGAVIDPDRDAPAVVRICRRLDGIPLAIELAAARARSLRPAEIADRLDDMFRLLTGGRRASVERHRTLRTTLTWSHDLLSQPQQALLARLSLFVGSFSLAAAQAVGGALGSDDTIDVIDQLVARSMVVAVEEAEESRFRLLEPIRQLAAEQLAARGEIDLAREAHTQWYLDLLVGLDERWRAGDDQGTWPVAARDLPNLKAAFDRLIEDGRVADAQRFTVAGFGPINNHFDYVPEVEWAPRTAAIDPDDTGPRSAGVCAIAAWGALNVPDLDRTATWLRRAEAAAERGSGEDDWLVLTAAMQHVIFGARLAVSDDFVGRTVDAAMRSDDLHRQIWVLGYTGRHEEAFARARQLGNTMLIAWTRLLLTGVRDDAAPIDELELTLEAAEASHSAVMVNHALHLLGAAHIRNGQPFAGLLQLRTAAQDWLMRGDSRVWDVVHTMATGLAATGDVATAVRLRASIGDRRLSFVPRSEKRHLGALIDAGLHDDARTRLERAGKELDAGAAVSEAIAAIEASATSTGT